MDTKTKHIFRDIPIDPRSLTHSVYDTIKEKISRICGECNEKDGYIMNVDEKSIKIGDGLIQSCGSMIIFKTDFFASSGVLEDLIIFIILSRFSTETDKPIKIWALSSAF